MIEDDVFEYYSDAMEESLFQKGEIYYYASVYWVDEKCEYYDVVDGWKEGTIAQAGTLKSSKEFAISKNLLVFERDVFEFHFDFRNENEIKEEVNVNNYETFSEAKLAIFEFIESWYNNRRIHSSLDYITPNEKYNNYIANLALA